MEETIYFYVFQASFGPGRDREKERMREGIAHSLIQGNILDHV